MQAKLTVIGGKANKREVVINLPATIGRSRDADLTVGHRMISRKHCEAYLVDGLMMIRDNGSLNGTYVHGKQIRQAPLLPDEKFTIGPITFRVSYEYNGDRSNLPPIVPAEEPAGDTMEVSDAAAAKPKETKSKENITEPVKPKTNSAPPAAKQAPSKSAPPPADDEPDFQIVEEDDDDFELALQEDLGEQLKPAAKEPEKKPAHSKPAAAQKPAEKKPVEKKPAAKKPVEKKEEPEEKDPEDQLLDDFLNDLQ